MSALSRVFSLVVCQVGLVALVPSSLDAQFKTTTQTVPLYVTVTDRDRRLVPDLVKEEFEVYDNDKLQALTNFDNNPTPITVVVMIDTSGSMTASLARVKEAAEQFLLRLLPADKGKVGDFSDKLNVYPGEGQPFTGNRDELIRLLRDELDFGYPTRLYDAVNYGINELRRVEGRKVVLVFTDGEDTASRLDAGEVLERARVDEVMVYSIGMVNETFDGARRSRTSPDRGLRKLSEETGGAFFMIELNKESELGATFTRVAQELHSQYVMGFTPATLDGKVHKLDVRIKRPGMTARARKSYVAAAPTSVPAGK